MSAKEVSSHLHVSLTMYYRFNMLMMRHGMKFVFKKSVLVIYLAFIYNLIWYKVAK